MNRKTTAVLLCTALGLFGYIAAFERNALTGEELEGRQERLFERFARTRVERIEIARGETTIQLVKPVLEDGSIGEWRMLSPMETLADENAINALLGALEWSDARREFRAESGDAERFGLLEPRIRLSLSMGQETLVIDVGDAQEAGGGVYVSDDGGATVKVAGLDVFEALDHDAEHFRTRRLAPAGVLTADSLRIEGGGDILDLHSSEERWTRNGLFVASAAVEEALEGLTNLEAESYEESAVGNTTLSVVARRPANGDIEAATLELTVGDECEGAGQVHAQVTFNGTPGPVACVLSSSLDPLRRDSAGWRELRPFTTSNTDLRSLRLERDGVILAIARDEDSEWSGTVPVDGDALEAWVREMRRSRARDVVATEDFASRGLDAPVATLTLTGTSGTQTLHVGSEAPEGLFVRRDEEAGVMVLDPAFLALLDVTGAAIRPRGVFAGESVEALSITRDGVREVLEPDVGQDWKVTAPVQLPADRSAIRELIADLLSMEALRFVGPATMEHGLETPHRTIEFTARVEETADPEEHRLVLGSETNDGRFAQFDGGDVFVIANVLVTRVRAPLVARDTLSVPTYEIDSIHFEGEGQEWSLEQRDGHFLNGEEPIDDELAGQITNALSRLRARPVSYNATSAADGFGGTAFASWSVTLEDGEVRTVQVGGSDGSGGVFLRGGGISVTFTTPEESLAPLFNYRP
ncbi:MAG: DUF4340 domain-containing protein [Polyangiales bacterium]